MERTRIKLSQEEFAKAKILNNYVAVELLRVEKDAKTHAGIYMGYLEDTTWEDDSETHPADIASVIGRVVKLPPKLYYNPNDKSNSLPWDTDMELEIGDLVWFNFIESLNANEVDVDGKIIRIIPFQDLYVAKREDFNANWHKEYREDAYKTYETICLNGYVILEQVPLPKISELDVVSEQKVYDDRGIVRYSGKPNRAYVDPRYSDNIEIQEGSLAYFRPGYQPFLLERRAYFAVFQGDKLFYCAQRRRLIFTT